MKQVYIIYWICFVVFVLSAAGCPDGWMQFQEKCYFFSDFVATFSSAGSYCQISNSKLVEPATAIENTFLKHEVVQKNVRFYIGVVDYFIESDWMYASSIKSVPVQVTNWGHNEPNSAGNEDCVEMVPGTGVWADVTCERSLNFICEKPVSGGTDPEIIGK